MERNNILDIYRVLLMLFVLLYHLGLCDAGYLAVCGFFVLSGYLLASKLNDEKFNLKEYYLKRLKTIYLPLIIVAFSTVFVFKTINIPWVTIKQEIQSVLLNYNNYYQILADNNYFIRSDASPFIHMWYISILIQIEVIMPLIIYPLKKCKIELNIFVLSFFTILSIVYFVFTYNKYGITYSYYDTFSRLFSFFIGYSIYYVMYCGENKFYLILILLLIIAMFLVGDLAQEYYLVLMISVSVLSALLMFLSSNITFKRLKIIDYFCKISYYVYLVQYPIIYIVDTTLTIGTIEKILIDVFLIIVISIIISYGLGNSKSIFRLVILCFVLVTTIIGGYDYIFYPDYYKEMDDLKQQLENNQKLMAVRQEEYLKMNKVKHNDAYDDISQINDLLDNMDDTTRNARIMLVGDSIMLGGSFNFDDFFNNYYCDAEGYRHGFEADETLKKIFDMGVNSDYIVIHLGTNSGLELEEVEMVNSLITNEKVFWLTVTDNWRDSENPMLEEYCKSHDNNYLIDWYNFSLEHKEYFGPDGLHLSEEGRYAYDQLIFDSIKEVIEDDLNKKKEEMIDIYNNQNNDTISFYGNDLLINLYSEFDNEYLYYADSNFDIKSLFDKLRENRNNLYLSKTIFILLDNSVIVTDEDINNIKEFLSDNDVYIFAYNKNAFDLNELLDNDCYLNDDIHLNNKGNKIIGSKILELIK